MSIEVNFLEEPPNAVEVRVTGKLHAEDYREHLPALEDRIREHGPLRMLAVMADFHGLEFGALWEDLKFDLRHYRDFDRVAVVGDRAWESWLTALCEPFAMAAVRYFEMSDYEEAKEWLLAEDISDPDAAASMVTPL